MASRKRNRVDSMKQKVLMRTKTDAVIPLAPVVIGRPSIPTPIAVPAIRRIAPKVLDCRVLIRIYSKELVSKYP